MIVTVVNALVVLVLAGNMLAFAGVDPAARFATAVAALVFALSMRRYPQLPRATWAAIIGVAALAVIQLVPLPLALRSFLQPGFSSVLPGGWAPLSLAPWATLAGAGSIAVAAVIALQAARMASTRSGLPLLLITIAGTGVLAAVLGLVAEGSDPGHVLFIRANVQSGGVYGPFVNHNHFAQAIELTTPAAMIFLAGALRRLRFTGVTRQRAVVTALAAAVAIVVSLAALIRCSSRGGILFMATATVVSIPWWRRLRQRHRPWVAVAVGVVVAAVILTLSWTRLPDITERMNDLWTVEGLQGNTRIDMWRSTLESWRRSPVVGSGIGAYRYVIGLDKPATGAAVLEQAHNDWLEWLETGGLVGAACLAVFVAALAVMLRPGSVRSRRWEFRYALAGAMLALTATALHEAIGFGLQTPVNRYLAAVWIGLVWGLWGRTRRRQEEGDAEPTATD